MPEVVEAEAGQTCSPERLVEAVPQPPVVQVPAELVEEYEVVCTGEAVAALSASSAFAAWSISGTLRTRPGTRFDPYWQSAVDRDLSAAVMAAVDRVGRLLDGPLTSVKECDCCNPNEEANG